MLYSKIQINIIDKKLMTEREKYFASLILVDGKSASDVARIFGLSRQRTSSCARKAKYILAKK